MAVKILSENFSRNPECANRLTSDIKLAAGLKHDGIVQTLELGQIKTTGCYYLVSEYVSGYSLGEWLRRSGRLAEADALVVAHFVANALRLAWNKARLIHGNIKPSNIMIDDEGTTKVADLGLAQALRMASALDDQKQSLQADAIAYMSPEMVLGQAAPDCRSDIYSLGATLHHMLTGKAPSGESESAVAGGRQPEVVSAHLQPVMPSLAIGSTRLIRKMMSQAPGDRYQKWEEVIADLTRLERGEQQEPAKADAAAAAPSPGASDNSALKPILVKAAVPSGIKPIQAGRQARVFTKKKFAHVPGVPVALPKLKRPATSFLKSARRSLYIAAAFHVILMLVAGTVIISRVLLNRETNFVGQPPPMRSFEPRKLEHKVKVQKRQRSSSRPSMAPRLVAMKASSFALPEIKVDSKSVKTSFAPKFTTVSGVGMGVGQGLGYGLGGFGQGVSTFDFFGIKGRTDRVVMLVDVSESMVDDIRDGTVGYLRVKEKIGRVIDELSEQGLFNVIVFADAASACSTNLMIASTENKQKAKQWLAPFNTPGNLGLVDGNLQQSSLGLQAVRGSTRLDLALTGAFEQGADTILVISDGLPRVKKAMTDKQKEEWDERVMQWERENATALKARARVISEHADEETKVWVPGAPATKRREGVPAREATEGHWETRRGWGGGGPALTPKPVPPESMLWWSLTDFVTHFTLLNREIYEKKGGKKAPLIHCIGYCIDDAGGDFLKGLAKNFKGNYRRVGGKAKTEDADQGAVKHIKTTQSKKQINPPRLPDPNAP